MDSADGAAVHVVLPNQRQQQTKAEAALQEAAAACRAPAHNEPATWSQDDPAKPDPSWSSCTMWTLFAVGWLFTPCWWLGVASGLTSGGDRSCLLRRRRGLKQGQKAAWWAHVIMSLVSALVVVLVCAIFFSKTGPERTAPSYLVLSGREDAYPNLNDQLKLRKVAEALHAALNLDDAYPAANIRIWLAAAQTISATPTRHLLEVRTKVVVLGYSLAKVPGLPAPAVLAALVQDTATTQKLAQRLAAAEFLAPQFASLVSIGFVPPTVKTPDEMLLQVTGGGADQHFLAPIGALLPSGPGPYFLMLFGEQETIPDLTDTAVLSKVSTALHGAFNLSDAYSADNIFTSVERRWEMPDQNRKLLEVSEVRLIIVLSYQFATSDNLPSAESLEAYMNDTGMPKVLADKLAVLDFITTDAHQNEVAVTVTTVRTADEAFSFMWIAEEADEGPAWDTLELIGKLPCRLRPDIISSCNATVPGGSGYLTRTPDVITGPTNGGMACPEPTVEACTTLPGCVGKPPGWAEGLLLADSSSWSGVAPRCVAVDGVYWHGDVCSTSCMQGAASTYLLAPVSARCNNGTWELADSVLVPVPFKCTVDPAPAEFAFDPASVPASGELNQAAWSYANFTGFFLHDKTVATGPLDGKLMCNNTYDLNPASTIAGTKSLVIMPTGGAMNATAEITARDTAYLPQEWWNTFWVVSLKHTATLTIKAKVGTAILSSFPVDLQPMAPQRIDVEGLTLPPGAAITSYQLDVTFGAPFCEDADVPVLVVDALSFASVA